MSIRKVPIYHNKTISNELVVLQLYGKGLDSDKLNVCMELTKDAIIGFATNAIRIALNNEHDFQHHWQIDPLNSPIGSQPLGFFLTDDSPVFVLMYNRLERESNNLVKVGKKIKSKDDFCFNYTVDLEGDEISYETFELGFNNIAKIVVNNSEGVDISKQCISVVLKINYKGLLNFGEKLLQLAHNFREGESYTLRSEDDLNEYDFGIILSKESPKLVIKCADLGCVFDYEPDYGKVR